MTNEAKFERKFKTPEEEVKWLDERVVESPEKAREITREHLEKKPEEVYAPERRLSAEELSRIEKRVVDVHYKEREKTVEYLFEIANEKGLLYAARVARKIDPAVMDAFHDRMVNYLHQKQNANS